MAKVKRDSFEYLGTEFQVRLIAQLLIDNKFAESIIEIIDPNYFLDKSHKFIISTIIDAYQKHSIIPDMGSIEIRLRDKIKSEFDLEWTIKQFKYIKEANLNDGLEVQDKAMRFCKQQELQKSIKEIQAIIDKGDFDRYEECEEILKKALEHGDNKDNGISVFNDIDSVLVDDFRNPIPTGIKGLDDVMDGGLAKSELAIILAPFGVGKAQPLTSKILTPNGWVKMGEINVNDLVIGRDGNASKVIGVYPQGIRQIYKVTFNDNTSTLCDGEHLWSVNGINQRNRSSWKNGKRIKLEPDDTFKVVKTIDIIDDLTFGSKKSLNYKIPIVSPVNFDSKPTIINPYVLVVLLGDGCITEKNQPHFVTKDLEIIENVKNRINKSINVSELFRDIFTISGSEIKIKTNSLYKVSILGIKNELIELGLFGTNSSNKFIPKDYLFNSISNRIELLQGLVDTDGYINKHVIEISTASEALSNNIKELVLSLGGRVSITKKQGSYKKNGIIIKTKEYYRVIFSLPDNGVIPSLLSRKRTKFNPRTKYSNNKFIKTIEYSHDEEAQCIMVDNSEQLYVTDDYIVTHNTTMITKIANTSKNLGKNVLQIFFEDMPKVIQRKHLACWSGYELNDLSLHKDELKELVEKKQEENGVLILKKFPSDGTTIPIIKQYVKKLIAQGLKPDIILLDYIDCVQPTRQFEDSYAGEGQVMRQFETMLAEYNIAGWTAVQGNRSSISSAVVQSDQMGGSIKKGQIGHFVVSIAKTLDQKENGTANMAILKSRFGKDGIVFDNIIFDNARIQIDMSASTVGKTQGEYKKEQEVSNVQRAAKALEHQQNLKKLLNGGVNTNTEQ